MKALLIDGQNFRGYADALYKDLSRLKLEWPRYNFKGLFDKVLGRPQLDKKVFYAAKIAFDERTSKISQRLIESQRALKSTLEKQGFQFRIAGRVRGHDETINGNTSLVFREKGVDVAIAVDMVTSACDETHDTIYLCSSDSDLLPAIRETRSRGTRIIYVGFQKNPNKGISFNADETVLLRDTEIFEFENQSLFG